LDRFLNTQFRLPHLGYHWTFASSPSLHYATPTRHTRLSRTSAHLRRLKRECSRALHSTFTPYSHHPSSIAIMSSHPCILLKSHHRSIPRSRTSASQARMFPRFARLCRLIHTPQTHRSRIIAITPISFRQLSPSYPQAYIVFACTRVASRNPLFYCTFTPLCRLTPPPFPRLARHRYTSLASPHLPQRHSHYIPLTLHTLIATSLVHHLMH
jgi:hypothetical protein